MLYRTSLMAQMVKNQPATQETQVWSIPWVGKIPWRREHLLVQSHSCVRLFTAPWIAAHQALLSFTNSWSLLKLMSVGLVMPFNHLILSCPLFLLPSIFPSIRVFPNESALLIRWPKHWSISFSISASNEYSKLVSFRIEWSDLFLVHVRSRVFSNITIQKHQFFGAQFSLWSKSHIHTWLVEKP